MGPPHTDYIPFLEEGCEEWNMVNGLQEDKELEGMHGGCQGTLHPYCLPKDIEIISKIKRNNFF